MTHIIRKRVFFVQAGLMVAAAIFAFSVMGSSLTSAAQTDLTPTPNGGGSGEIAFHSNRDGNWDIYVMNADGSNQHNITNTPQSPTLIPCGALQ